MFFKYLNRCAWLGGSIVDYGSSMSNILNHGSMFNNRESLRLTSPGATLEHSNMSLLRHLSNFFHILEIWLPHFGLPNGTRRKTAVTEPFRLILLNHTPLELLQLWTHFGLGRMACSADNKTAQCCSR